MRWNQPRWATTHILGYNSKILCWSFCAHFFHFNLSLHRLKSKSVKNIAWTNRTWLLRKWEDFILITIHLKLIVHLSPKAFILIHIKWYRELYLAKRTSKQIMVLTMLQLSLSPFNLYVGNFTIFSRKLFIKRHCPQDPSPTKKKIATRKLPRRKLLQKICCKDTIFKRISSSYYGIFLDWTCGTHRRKVF